jgi:hypothetical protein
MVDALREPRRTFALTGPSQPIDPRVNAVRADIADVRLADRVFAPHYAAPLARTLTRDASLRSERSPASDPLVDLAKGARFDLLDVTGGVAWGIAMEANLVGYLDADAIAAG